MSKAAESYRELEKVLREAADKRYCISWGKDSGKEPVWQQISRKEETPYKINRDQQRKWESDHIRRRNCQSGN